MVLQTKGLIKIYKQGDIYIKALKNCHISVEEGEFVAITGVSGSGKSTLLNLCGGLDKPTGGKVFIDEQDIYSLSSDELAKIRRQKLGFVFQTYHLMKILTAYENIIIPTLMDNRKVDKEYFRDLAEQLGISDRLNHYPNQLSGGQQQRVAIARALINKPRIILADEPTGNLDKETSDEVLEVLLNSVRKFNQTMLMITHNMDIAAKADRIIHIDNGEIMKNHTETSYPIKSAK